MRPVPRPTTGAAPGAQRNEGRGDFRGAQPGREDQRGLREGGPGVPSPNARGTSAEGRRGPQAGAPGPSTSGAAPSSREHELRNRAPQGAASPQEPRGRERSGSKVRRREVRVPRANAGQPSAPLQARRPNLLWRQGEVRLQALRPRDRTPLPPPRPPRPQSPTTTGAAPGGRAEYREAPAGAREAAVTDPLMRYRRAHSNAPWRAAALRGLRQRRGVVG